MRKRNSEKPADRLVDRSKMAIEFRRIDDLLPYAKNARTHSPQQVSEIAASMRVFGWTNPVLIDESGIIIAGHGRILAAKKLGLTDDIPCIVLTGLTESQKRALIIADNKIAMNAGWDNDLLVQELGDIHSDDFPLEVVGFSAKEIDRLLNGGQVDPADEGSNAISGSEHTCPKCGHHFAD